MRLQTPDGSELIEVVDVQPYEDGIIVSGQIMGAMPMKAVLRPSQLRGGLRLLSVGLVLRLLSMLLRRG